MKKGKIISLILAIVLLLCPLEVFATETDGNVSAETQPEQTFEDLSGDSSVSNGCHSLNAQKPLWGEEQLTETAKAAILYELNSDTMLYSWNPDMQVYPASLVKIMTCLLAVENCALNEQVTVTTTAIATLPKDTTLNFQIGEVWSMEQMLYCLMVGGYNDAAVVIAEHVAGSQQAFVHMMNNRAKEIGCTNTHFSNANGFHADDQLSTARDLVKILYTALQNEKFVPFFTETVYRLPANDLSPAKYMETPNYMMTATVTAEYYDPKVTGGRTGVTEERERCIIVTAKSKGLHYIAIIMCAKATMDDEGKIVRFGSYEEARDLLKIGFDGQRVTQVLSEDQILTQYPVVEGANSVTVGPSASFSTVLPEDLLTANLSYRYENTINSLTAPVAAGQQINTVQVWYGNVCIAQSPIITKNASEVLTVENPSEGIERNDEGMKIALRLAGILLAIVLLAAGTVYGIRFVKLANRRASYRRRRQNRRRSR